MLRGEQRDESVCLQMMTTVQRLTSALGRPQALQEVAEGTRFLGAVGRWRHEGARMDLEDLDTVQVVFNVSGGQRVKLCGRAGSACRTVRAGSVGIVSPGPCTRVDVTGPADTVQIIVSRQLLGASVAASSALSPAHRQASLQTVAIRALMELARGSRHSGRDPLENLLRQAAALLATRAATPRRVPARGGLSPMSRRRVHALVNERLQAGGCAPLPVDELARAAGLSMHHFIKAFRQTEGGTPYAKMITRRLDLALSLLLQANARVDWIAMQTGFASPAHFVSAFRQHLGITPGALRDAAGVGP